MWLGQCKAIRRIDTKDSSEKVRSKPVQKSVHLLSDSISRGYRKRQSAFSEVVLAAIVTVHVVFL